MSELTLPINRSLLDHIRAFEETQQRPWSWVDFKGLYTYGTLRVYISRLRKEGKVLRWHGRHHSQQYVLADGKLTKDHMGGLTVNYEEIVTKLTDKLMSLTYGPFMLHDIRLLTHCDGIWARFRDLNYTYTTANKDITLPQINFGSLRYAIVKVHHTDNISITLACSYSPFVQNAADMLLLYAYTGEIRRHIHQLSNMNIPEVNTWIHTLSHINRDAKRASFTDKEFDYTLQMYGDSVLRIYNKFWKEENQRRVRVELINNNRKSLGDVAEEILFQKACDLLPEGK